MTCFTCGAALKGAGKFCSACGAAVAPAKPSIDPFASTIQPNANVVPPAAPSEPGASSRSPQHVSPLASSQLEFSESVRELVVPEADPARGSGAPKSEKGLGSTVQMKQVAPRPPAASKAPSVMPPSFGVSSDPSAALGPGMAVRVRWADGQKYPGTVWQLHGTQVLVSFQNGQRHWVEAAFVERT